MPEYECLSRVHKRDSKLGRVLIETSGKLSGKRVWLTLPDHPVRTIALRSHDKKGFVYQVPNSMWGAPWKFVRVYSATRVVHRNLSQKRHHILYMDYFHRCLSAAIGLEVHVCLDLIESGFVNASIYHLPESGVHSGGSDIVVAPGSVQKTFNRPYEPKQMVHDGYIAIEVLGVNYGRGNKKNRSKLKFSYGYRKNFKDWIDDCYRYGTIPVIAWVEYGEVWYVPMGRDHKELHDIFYTDYDKKTWGYRQRTGLSPVRHAVPFKVNGAGLYDLLMGK